MPTPRGRGWPVAKRREVDSTPHAIRPDGDNLEKFVNDAMNGLLWDDDSQIVWMIRSKTYINAPIGEIEIYAAEIPKGKMDYDNIVNIIDENIEALNG